VLERTRSTEYSSTLIVDHFSLINADVTRGILHPSVHRYLSPTGIIPLIEPYTTAVLDLLQKEGSRFEGVSTPLHDFVLPVVSRASAYAFFGRSFPAVELGGPLRAFDGSFQLLLAGIPRVLLRSGTNGLATMHTLLEMYFDGPHDDASEFVLESEQVMRKHGYVCLILRSAGNIGTLIERDFRIREPSGLFSSFSYRL